MPGVVLRLDTLQRPQCFPARRIALNCGSQHCKTYSINGWSSQCSPDFEGIRAQHEMCAASEPVQGRISEHVAAEPDRA